MKRVGEWLSTGGDKSPCPSETFSIHNPVHVRGYFTSADTEALLLARETIDDILAWRQTAGNTIDEMRASPTGV